MKAEEMMTASSLRGEGEKREASSRRVSRRRVGKKKVKSQGLHHRRTEVQHQPELRLELQPHTV
jgi:hypothetical protein